MTTVGAAELPDGVWEKFKALLKRDEAKIGPSGVWRPPPRHQDWDWPRMGGGGTPTMVPNDHCDPNKEKSKRAQKEGRMNVRRHATSGGCCMLLESNR
jgi:hypothetical protein